MPTCAPFLRIPVWSRVQFQEKHVTFQEIRDKVRCLKKDGRKGRRWDCRFLRAPFSDWSKKGSRKNRNQSGGTPSLRDPPLDTHGIATGSPMPAFSINSSGLGLRSKKTTDLQMLSSWRICTLAEATQETGIPAPTNPHHQLRIT